MTNFSVRKVDNNGDEDIIFETDHIKLAKAKATIESITATTIITSNLIKATLYIYENGKLSVKFLKNIRKHNNFSKE